MERNILFWIIFRDMNKKIRNLVVITLLLIIAILILVIWNLVSISGGNDTRPATADKTADLEAVPIEDPIGDDGMKIHTSENGYSVRYPADMTAKSMAKSVDFILEDDKSGSSLNIVTAKNDGSVKKMSREEFEHSLEHTSEEIKLISYEKILLNGTEAVAVEYDYMGNITKQFIIITESYAYNITVTKSSYISQEVSAIFDSVAESFVLN